MARNPFRVKHYIRSQLDVRYAEREALRRSDVRLIQVQRVMTLSDEQAERLQHLHTMLTARPSSLSFFRAGRAGDGGYVMASGVDSGTFVLSLGVGSETSADRCLADRGARVLQLDPFVEASPLTHPNVCFRRLGITGRSGIEGMITIDQALDLGGARDTTTRRIMLMDVEGAEWDVLRGTSTELNAFEQIVVELHGMDLVLDPSAGPILLSCVSRLVSDHVPVFLHANNCSAVYAFGGFYIPSVVEVTLVRNDKFSAGAETVPPHLVHPNDARVPDVPQTNFFQRCDFGLGEPFLTPGAEGY